MGTVDHRLKYHFVVKPNKLRLFLGDNCKHSPRSARTILRWRCLHASSARWNPE